MTTYRTIAFLRENLSLLVAVAWLTATPNQSTGAVIYKSAALGPTGVLQGSVAATNVNSAVFPGVRFELTLPVITSQVGGHFVSQSGGTFFGAIVSLDGPGDFPNSSDLSSSDVLGAAVLSFPETSAEVSGGLSLSLSPGWYALVFGSGLFGANGDGAAPQNNTDIGDPSYIAYEPNLGWIALDRFPMLFENHRFIVSGVIVPEPTTFWMAAALLTFLNRRNRKR
jgi:hypothetical protein